MRIIATMTFLGVLCTTTCSFGNTARSACVSNNFSFRGSFQEQTDASGKDTSGTDTGTVGVTPIKKSLLKRLESKSGNLDPKKLAIFPAVTLQQYLKGEAAGLYVQESTGEPGAPQTMFIRGTSQPLLSQREVFQSQPLVILDGIPLTAEHPYALDIQQYKFERIGPGTDPLSIINMDNIESVQVLKDISATAIYGPKAVNGVILLTSKPATTKRKITFDSYVGMATPNAVTTVNGNFENQFRRQFYDRYTGNGSYSDNDVYPLYLSDSLNNAYYGPANWDEQYYNSGLAYGANAAISGGTSRANFRFSFGALQNQGVADDTGIERYNTRFLVNMQPIEWLTMSAMVNASVLNRDRNRNLRDRFAQVNYLPDLSSPLAPNKDRYNTYLAEFDKGFDENKTNAVQGYFQFAFNFDKLKITSTLGADYNEGYRDIFFARTLLQNSNYASNYYGYSQRAMIDNVASYDLELNDDNKFNFQLGASFQFDSYKYQYAYAYRGSNDYIKINLLNADALSGSFLNPSVFSRELTYKFLDRTRNNLISFNARATYEFKEKYTISAMLRNDGTSNQQPTSRWFLSPVVSAGWDMKKEFFEQEIAVSSLNMRASAGRLGRYEHFDNYSQGPQYTAYIGFTGNVITPGYNGFSVLTRPYSTGNVGYNIDWAYQDQLSLGVDAGFAEDRIRASVDVYIKEDKNMLLGLPAAAEYGYTSLIRNGMNIRNSGVEVSLGATVLPSTKTVSWTTALNVNYNRNELTALPGGLKEIVIGDRMLRVGESVGSYWLLTNDGMYNADGDVPAVGGVKRRYNGIEMKAGDPNWRDINGDNLIDNQDRTIQGNSLPLFAGGFNNTFGYKKWSLDLNFYYNFGRDLINQDMANRFDFVNREGQNNINSVREITFWEKRGEYSKYPLYNPWSSVAPFQANQDLFLENGSFVKLRTLSLGYDLTEVMKKKSANVARFYVYGSVNNVFTLTKYTGQDPELVNYTGYDSGYGIQLPRTYLLGVKLDF
ncbi:SusC/RagA family TonB-linked outer membrane protein [Pedobacter faecalis]|uniref:SusC/RagA family TonB-linked outer membrane protein n=1 Tax=Pedobacter faecalis TaxID=3041495 RepID=UPI0025506E48|nr:SusC/RagA family TonB-linked outer membrane protein [Pedobacter sp. ELA7]